MFKVVIFDWDGTLADTKKAVVESFKRVLTEIDCTANNEFLERRIGTGMRKMLEDALNKCNVTFDDRMLEEFARKKVKLQKELSESVILFEGATDLLDALYGKTKIALATMSSRPVIDKLLLEKKIKKYFNAVVTADEISTPKPDTEIFLVSTRAIPPNISALSASLLTSLALDTSASAKIASPPARLIVSITSQALSSINISPNDLGAFFGEKDSCGPSDT